MQECGNIAHRSQEPENVMKRSQSAFLLAATAALMLSALAAPPVRADDTINRQAKDAGHAVAQNAKDVGHSIAVHSRRLSHVIARDSRVAGREIARRSRATGHAIARGARQVGLKVRDDAHKTRDFIERPPPAKTAAQ